MKNLVLLIMLFLSISVYSQEGYTDGSLPSAMYVTKFTDNPFLLKGDVVYSAFKVDNAFYASYGAKYGSSTNFIVKVFPNTGSNSIELSFDSTINVEGFNNSMPVKVGLNAGEKVYWILKRGNYLSLLDSVGGYKDAYYKYIKFAQTDNNVVLLDNPYWSLPPTWPDNLELRIKEPKAGYNYTLYQLQYTSGVNYRLQMPTQINNLAWEVVEGSATVKNTVYFNSAVFKFTQDDVNRGYIKVKMYGNVLKNSTSTDTFRIYTIYWK